ncbi:tripartite tricarboxylate transporter substrate binding protein [Stutzerimonas tarimensis]|uniref:Tripartite tricarboxylate transporter substrate binding protein n=1 Tax=Stutzerimonas tarimensis TaxID=1507735 RepID=A0ABV7T9G3_9GAMM
MIRKLMASLAVAGAGLAMPALAQYPERDIQAVVPWAAGGATDLVMRQLVPLVEEALDRRLIISNRTGGTGVIGSTHVLQQTPDGHTLLLAAENAQLYPLLGLANFDYSDFHTINIIGQGVAVIAAPVNSPYDNLEQLLAAAKENPDALRMGVTGTGGLPSLVRALIETVDELKVREITFAGDRPGIEAMLAGHLDFMPLSLVAGRDLIRRGSLKGLAVVATKEVSALPGVAPITDTLPGMEKYLPWGPFWGVWVRKEVPEHAKQRLSVAFSAAVADEQFQAFLAGMGAYPLNLTGDDARHYLERWQSVTSWSLYEAGSTRASPEKLRIARP